MPASLSNIAEESLDPGTPDDLTIASDIYNDDYGDMSHFTNSRKRKRPEESFADAQHKYWSEDLLNYFMLSEDPADPHNIAPTPPEGIDLDRAIDEKGNSALHWASAMGDLNVVKELLARGADIHSQSDSLETPLMRAVIFTNNFDRQTMDKLAGYFVDTVAIVDVLGNTVFHHIANTTQSKPKYACARYYLDCILNKMAERYSPVEIEEVLNTQDHAGDTAMTIAARHGARKCVRSLIGRNAAVDIPNHTGQTADELIVRLNHRRRDGRHRQLSSSPFQMDPAIAAVRGLAQPMFGANINTTSSSRVSGLSSPPSATPTQRKHTVHASEAATALTTQFLPLLQSKSLDLATAFDAEMAEKDAELLEARAAIKGREEEIETLKRQARGLEIALAEQDSSVKLLANGVIPDGSHHGSGAGAGAVAAEQDYDARLDAELAALEAQCERILESEQTQALSSALNADHHTALDTDEGATTLHPYDEDDFGPELHALLTSGSSSATDDQQQRERTAKMLFATRIAALQVQRRDLVREVVRHRSLAGTGLKQAEYKRLMAGALGVDEARVESMVPELLSELEMDLSQQHQQQRGHDIGFETAVGGAGRRVPVDMELGLDASMGGNAMVRA